MITAIETRYAGCKFRSRLEARWAVFFDRMAIKWEYEQQGYLLGPESHEVFRNHTAVLKSPPRRPYLPDFWLPLEKLWVEVKGSEDDLDHAVILDAVITHWGLPPTRRDDEYRMLILGPLPRPGGRIGHSILDFHKGDSWRDWAEFGITGLLIHQPSSHETRDDDWLGNDSGDVAKPQPGLTSCAYLPGTPGEFVTAAYTAARSARFEHGQSGA